MSSPVGSSSIPGTVLAKSRARDATDTPAANVLLTTYGAFALGADGLGLVTDSTKPFGLDWQPTGVATYFVGTAKGQRFMADPSLPAKGSFRGPIGCRAVTASAGAQTVANNASAMVAFSSADEFDTDGMHDPAVNNTRITCPVDGIISFSGFVQLSVQISGGGGVVTAVYKNGASGNPGWQGTFIVNGGGQDRSAVNGSMNVVAGDYIEMQCSNQATASTITIFRAALSAVYQ